MFNHIHYDIPKLERDTQPDGTRYYKTPSGKSYPSVTTVTGLLKKDGILEWRKRVGEDEANRVSRKAAARGTRIHTLCEHHLLNNEVTPNMFDYDMWSTLKPELKRINNIHALETALYSDHLQVAGTVDCIAEFDGVLSVIDFKTSARVKERQDIYDYFMQCSAYAVAFEERTKIPVPQLVIIMGVDESYPRIFVEKRNNWIGPFKALRMDYRNQKGI